MERWTIVGEMDWLLNLEGMVGCLSTNVGRTSRLPGGGCPKYRHEGGWLTETSISRNLAKTCGEGERARDGKGQRTTGKLEDSAAGSFRTLLSRKLTFPSPPPLPTSAPRPAFTYGLVCEQRCLLTVFHSRESFFRVFASFFFFLRELSLTPTPFLELCATSSDEINLLESSYVDESVNLQGFKSSKVE